MIEFSLIQINDDDSILDILGNLKSNVLQRIGDNLVYNGNKFNVSRVVFSFDDNICDKIIIMVKTFNTKSKTVAQNLNNNRQNNPVENNHVDYGSIFIWPREHF